MVARFSDRKSLVLTYSTLLNVGVPSGSMQVRFDEVDNVAQPAREHQGFLQRLHRWLTHTAVESSQELSPALKEAGAPQSALFQHSGGTLQVERPEREAAVIAVIVQHSGELVA